MADTDEGGLCIRHGFEDVSRLCIGQRLLVSPTGMEYIATG